MILDMGLFLEIMGRLPGDWIRGLIGEGVLIGKKFYWRQSLIEVEN